ncbi:hypothetical protein NFI96_005845 [Prochilodus magdalenae]|nr:hypothetical protein NFI96_005845 [Prochilodus magdalenae]
MKVFERLILAHLKSITDPLLDPLQFAYRANRSVDDVVNLTLHFILQHLDSHGNYARVLFVDFSSAFNTVVPQLLQAKLSQLSVPGSMCRWIVDFLTDRRQQVRLGKQTSDFRTLSTGVPQGCVLSPLLFSLYTNDCVSKDPAVKILKFADDSTLVGLIANGDESAYRKEIEQLVSWCSNIHLLLNTEKTVEMVVDFRRNPPPLPPLQINNTTVSTQVPGHHHLQRLEMGEKHHLHHQESSTENVLLETAEEIPPATDPDDPVLHSDHRVHSHSLHNHLVWFLHLTRKNQTPAHHQDSREDHWM